jgi:hypothetical protein
MYIDGDSKSYRIDHIYWNTITGMTSARIFWFAKSTGSWSSEGVFDHNNFVNWAWGAVFHYQPAADGGNNEWMVGAQLGSSHAIYIEDNTFSAAGGGYYLTDNNGASRWVFRYNDISNAYIAGHDAQVGGYRGALKLEAYNNTFTFNTSGNCYIMYRAGANGVFFNNTMTGSNILDCNYPLNFANYRNDGPYGWPSACSSTSGNAILATNTNYVQSCTSGTGCIKTDGSSSSPNGYPCRDQVGVSGNDPQVGGGSPFLFWNNTINGSDASSHIAVGFGSSFIVANRDYCTTATTMPTSCNGVTTTYIPYTYPHPLAGGSPPTQWVVSASTTTRGPSSSCVSPVNNGSTTTCTAVPVTGYRTSSISGCGGTWTSGNSYTTGAITANCTVTFAFTPDVYIVTPVAGSHSHIAPYSAQTITNGLTTSFTVTADAGYTAACTGCGGALSAQTYTTGIITSNCTVTASAYGNPYTIGGTIYSMPVGTLVLQNNSGDNLTIVNNNAYQDVPFTFSLPLVSGATYSVSVFSNQTGASCSILANGTGTVGGSNITNIVLACYYTVSASASAECNIYKSGNVNYRCGFTGIFNVYPNAGYSVTSVTGTCGGSLIGASYTTNSITANCTVVANCDVIIPPNLTIGSGNTFTLDNYSECY